MLFATVIVLLACLSSGLTINCPSSTVRWCSTPSIAEACGVKQQCEKFVWKKVTTDSYRVNFTLYYETLCPDCRHFVSTQLWKAFQTIPDIMNISFVPYGNAKELYRPETKLYQFYCQHGADECYGNLIHTCVLNFYPNVTDHLPFIHCTESTDGDIQTISVQCAQQTKIDFDKVTSCVQSRLGNQLQHMYAVQTESLQPPHQYVPWVTVNGVHTEDIEQQAETDLVKLICQTYKGPNRPAACQQQ